MAAMFSWVDVPESKYSIKSLSSTASLTMTAGLGQLGAVFAFFSFLKLIISWIFNIINEGGVYIFLGVPVRNQQSYLL